MKRVAAVVVFVVCVLGVTFADEPKKEDPVPKAKLPVHWKALGITTEQHDKYDKLAQKYNTKIAALKKELKDTEDEFKSEEMKLLSDAQKEQLKKLILKEPTPPVEKDKPATDKPVTDKDKP